MWGQELPKLTGGTGVMNPNHHLSKPVLIGEIRTDGQFDIISQIEEVMGEAWSRFPEENDTLTSDWQELGCGMYDTATESCGQLISKYWPCAAARGRAAAIPRGRGLILR